MKIKILSLLLFAAFFVGCGDDEPEEGNVQINFKMLYDGEPMVMSQEYQYPGNGKSFNLDRFSMFLTDVKLDGEVELDRTYMRLEEDHLDLESAMNGSPLVLEDVPTGSYSKLAFNIGLPPDLNAMVPEDFETGDPLADANEWWLAWESYIFFKIEGKFDKNENGIMDEPIALHSGSDAAFTTVELEDNIQVRADETVNVDLNIDFYEFFTYEGIYNLDSVSIIHHKPKTPSAIEIAGRLANSFSVE